jgi:anaerobic selenocysteine-containing dehydrogenase
VAGELRRVRQTYGPAAILDCSRSGNTSMLHNRVAVQRLLHMFGGCTELWSNISAEAEVFAVRHTYGAKAEYKSAGREPTDYVNSRLIVMWGWSPGNGTFGTGTYEYLKLAKKQGVRIVCVDPRVSRASANLADEHVFIRPSTDAAALIAMAYVIASEGLHDQAYLDRHVLGFDEAHLPAGAPPGASYLSYLYGVPDGVRKTGEWAAALTGVPAAMLRRLAIEFATSRPAALHCGYAPGRTIHGEQFHRAAYALAAMTGNVGVSGGNSGSSNGATGRAGIRTVSAGENPAGARVASSLLADLLARGRAGGYPADIKLIYSSVGDLFNQLPNVHKTVAAAQGLEFMVVHEHFITPTARYADIVLPATTYLETEDIYRAYGAYYLQYAPAAVPPQGQARSNFRLAQELAQRMGLADPVFGMEAKAAIGELWRGATRPVAGLDLAEVFRGRPINIAPKGGQEFRTPSGKLEFYSEQLARAGLAPMPDWQPDPQEQRDAARWPLRLLTAPGYFQAHTAYSGVDFLRRREGMPYCVLHPDEARRRRLVDGGKVRLFNERGEVGLVLKVSDEVLPGVVLVPGQRPDEETLGGTVNMLCSDRYTDMGDGATYQSTWLDVR